MKFTETKLAGVYLIEPKRFEDERGFFSPIFSAKEFAARNLASVFVENNISYSKNRGTLRGIHYQAPPHGQDKVVRCTRGKVFDVAVDLRPDSSTFKQWMSVELSAENRVMLYLPGDCGHGFQTLVDDNAQWQRLIADDILWELAYAPSLGHPAKLSGREEAVRHATWFAGAVENFRFLNEEGLNYRDHRTRRQLSRRTPAHPGLRGAWSGSASRP